MGDGFSDGPLGAGKNTLLRLLLLLDRTTGGEIREWGTHRFYSGPVRTPAAVLGSVQEHRLLFDQASTITWPAIGDGRFSPKTRLAGAGSLGRGWLLGGEAIRPLCPVVNSTMGIARAVVARRVSDCRRTNR